ncbi:MAG: hypothetical protein JNG88_06810 [Phycisphaerales bacterium]|nr:hypothetical protein [Phycisphaerales bacterium]
MSPKRLLLVFAAIGVTVWVAGAAGVAMAQPILVYTAADLDNVRNNLTAEYLQMADIDLTNHHMLPIGTGATPFEGVYDGNGYRVKNYSYTNSSQNNVGLFGMAMGATFKNIIVENANVTGALRVGGMVGHAMECSIANCRAVVGPLSNTLPRSSAQEEAGGLIGRAHASVVDDCYSEVRSHTTGRWSGVLIGHVHLESLIVNCSTAGYATGGQGVGGLSGNCHGATMEYCHSTSRVRGGIVVGGLIGWIQEDRCEGNPTIVRNCTYSGTVENTSVGLVMFNDPCGNLFIGFDSNGGIGGWADDYSEVRDCEATVTIISAATSDTNCGGIIGNARTNCVVSGCETTVDIVSGNTCGGIIGWAAQDTLIEYCTAAGSIECEWQSGGLVGAAERCTIQYCESSANVNCTGAANQHAESGHELAAVGGLVGYTFPSASQQFHTRIHCCVATGNVSGHGQMMGGLVGLLWGCLVTESYATGSVTADDRKVGGLVGAVFVPDVGNSFPDANEISEVRDCYATGIVTQITTIPANHGLVGGFAGHHEGSGQRINKIFRSYSVGLVTAPSGAPNVGGLIGGRDPLAQVNYCYWDTQTSGQSSSAGGTGKTTAEMKMQATFQTWNFTSIWNMLENVDYPWLRCSAD